MRFVQRRFEEKSRSAAGSGACDQKSHRKFKHDDRGKIQQQAHNSIYISVITTTTRLKPLHTAMPATRSTTTGSPSVAIPTTLPLVVQRPTLCKRKLSEASVASPTSLDEVASNSSADERVISPKKKAKADERASGVSNKWENHVVISVASALDMDTKDCSRRSSELDPIAFAAAPVTEFAADELHILRYFLS